MTNPASPVRAKHSHYHKPLPKGLTHVDVYWVLRLFDVRDPCLQHAIKKLLVAGGRGAGKDFSRDVQEAIDSCQRAIEMDVEACSEVELKDADTPFVAGIPLSRIDGSKEVIKAKEAVASAIWDAIDPLKDLRGPTTTTEAPTPAPAPLEQAVADSKAQINEDRHYAPFDTATQNSVYEAASKTMKMLSEQMDSLFGMPAQQLLSFHDFGSSAPGHKCSLGWIHTRRPYLSYLRPNSDIVVIREVDPAAVQRFEKLPSEFTYSTDRSFYEIAFTSRRKHVIISYPASTVPINKINLAHVEEGVQIALP